MHASKVNGAVVNLRAKGDKLGVRRMMAFKDESNCQLCSKVVVHGVLGSSCLHGTYAVHY